MVLKLQLVLLEMDKVIGCVNEKRKGRKTRETLENKMKLDGPGIRNLRGATFQTLHTTSRTDINLRASLENVHGNVPSLGRVEEGGNGGREEGGWEGRSGQNQNNEKM